MAISHGYITRPLRDLKAVFSINRLYAPQLAIEKPTRRAPETRHLVEDGQSEVRTKLSWEISCDLKSRRAASRISESSE
jgi:hypothetical protein